MGKDFALYQLMDIRMNGVMNGIMNNDGEYQAIIRKPDEYFGWMEWSKEVQLLIGRYDRTTGVGVSYLYWESSAFRSLL